MCFCLASVGLPLTAKVSSVLTSVVAFTISCFVAISLVAVAALGFGSTIDDEGVELFADPFHYTHTSFRLRAIGFVDFCNEDD